MSEEAGRAGRCEQLLRRVNHCSWPCLQINSGSLARSLETCSFLSGVCGGSILEKSSIALETVGKSGLSWAVPVCLWLCIEAKNSYPRHEAGLTLVMNLSLVMVQSGFVGGD